ncbi:hypothetical protein VPH526E571_0008 [Vibrio phage 526E57-1]
MALPCPFHGLVWLVSISAFIKAHQVNINDLQLMPVLRGIQGIINNLALRSIYCSIRMYMYALSMTNTMTTE